MLVSLLSLSLAACGGDDDGDGGDGVDGGGGGAAPELVNVSWTFAEGCTPNQPSQVTVEMTVEDADTAADALTYSGMATGCSGTINSNPATITCPNIQPYNGTVTVMDPEGNSDSQGFTINVCTDGSAP